MADLNIFARWRGEQAEAGAKRLQGEIRRTTAETDRMAISTAKAGSATAMSSEKIARYGTFALIASGQMRTLGVSTELVSTSVLVAQQAMMGMLGTFGLITVAVGAAVAVISKLVTEQKRLKEETRAATLELLKQKSALGDMDQVTLAAIVTGQVTDIQEALQKKRAEAAGIGAVLQAGVEVEPKRYITPMGVMTRIEETEISERRRTELEAEWAKVRVEIITLEKVLAEMTGTVNEAALSLGRFNPYNPEAFGPEEAPRYLMRRAVEAAPRLEPIGIERMRGAEQFSLRDFRKEQEQFKSELEAVDKEFHERIQEDVAFARQQYMSMAAELQMGFEGAFQAMRGGWQSLVDYMKDYIMNQLIKSVAGSLVNLIMPGGGSFGIFGNLFSGGAQANPSNYGVGGAYRDNASWRMMR